MATIQKITLKTGKVSYRVFIRLGELKPITKTFKTKKSATEFARRIEGDSDLARALGNPVSSAYTLADIIDQFIKHYRKKDPCILLRLKWWRTHYGDRKLSEFNANDVRQALVKVKQSGRSDPTLNRYKANLSTVFEYAKEHAGIDINPCRQVKAKPENRGRIRFLDDCERASLLAACKASQWKKLYLIALMALTTGARRGELLNLTWQDIDFKTRLATLHDSKNGHKRILPLTQEVMHELKEFQEVGSGYVFPSTNGTKPAYFRGAWGQAVKRAGLVNFTFHDLRHSCASYLAQNGATLIQIAEVLGHSNTAVTSRYAHLCIEHKQNLIDTVLGDVGL